MNLLNAFYHFKPIIPRNVQLFFRRCRALIKKPLNKDIWPIHPDSAEIPKNWKGWPDGKKFAFILTHDVDNQRGHDRCRKLMKLEIEFGFRSSYNFVPECYLVSRFLRETLVQNGFEVGIHGLNHDGKLYASKKIFRERARKINRYIQDWGVLGFRSPSMHHHFEWLHQLNIVYDTSTFDTDPFEPQSDGVTTIFPFIVTDQASGHCYVELPYTLVQDFSLFIVLKEKTIDIWKKKIDWIAKHGGMVLVNVHPDYMRFDNRKLGPEEFPFMHYVQLLKYVQTIYPGEYWHALPRDIASYVRDVYKTTTG